MDDTFWLYLSFFIYPIGAWFCHVMWREEKAEFAIALEELKTAAAELEGLTSE